MLILTRSKNQTVTIGDDIRVTVLDVRGSQVRIGIDAPRTVTVDREEIHAKRAAGIPAPVRGLPEPICRVK